MNTRKNIGASGVLAALSDKLPCHKDAAARYFVENELATDIRQAFAVINIAVMNGFIVESPERILSKK